MLTEKFSSSTEDLSTSKLLGGIYMINSLVSIKLRVHNFIYISERALNGIAATSLLYVTSLQCSLSLQQIKLNIPNIEFKIYS